MGRLESEYDAILEELARHFIQTRRGFVIHKFREPILRGYDKIDWRIQQTAESTREMLADFKRRENSSGRYETVPLNVRKWADYLNQSARAERPLHLIYGFYDGLWTLPVQKLTFHGPDLTLFTRFANQAEREQIGAVHDAEVCAMLPAPGQPLSPFRLMHHGAWRPDINERGQQLIPRSEFIEQYRHILTNTKQESS